MFRLAHLSDPHLGPLPDIRYRELLSKRVTGYINWQRNRKRALEDATLTRICDDLWGTAPDHVAVTGDLVNLALDAEIEAARLWLEGLGDPAEVSVVPGNHDAYVPGALVKACHSWGSWMSNDNGQMSQCTRDFPFMRTRGPVAIIGVSTARASAPFMATGYFRARQAARLTRLLHDAGARGLFRVILIHHPPVRKAISQQKRLYGISLFQRVVARAGAELVLHGHTHLPTVNWIEGRTAEVPVIGVAAAGQSPGGHKPAARYNLFEIDGEAGNWSLAMRERGVTGHSTPVSELSHCILKDGNIQDVERLREATE